jgi:glycosyltransferase involved in cell wall biosynthesis
MVLLEAMTLGIPCISFKCPSGPSDIIKDNEDGILVELENKEAMIEAIDRLITDHNKRNEMGENAYNNIQRFSPTNIYNLWNDLFNQVGTIC